MTSIKVVCRIRPPNALELQNDQHTVLTCKDECSVQLQNDDFCGSFSFDRVFDTDSTQEAIFAYSIQSIVDDLFLGYNGTILAYGQTGSGKTYTMMGNPADAKERGVTPRIVERIFAAIQESPSSIEYTVKVSFLDIYMERVRDLLEPEHDNLSVHEDPLRGVYVKNLRTFYVTSAEEVLDTLEEGNHARAVAATNMNAQSSRSHAIFIIEIGQTNVETGEMRHSRLLLVDLAGSESVGKTGAVGQTLEEAKKINRSLSTLGMVIHALSEGKSHVPYRDSKLTRILKESMGGNSRTTLVINCSPSSWNAAETLSTLRFGTRTKQVKNKAIVNTELSVDELKRRLYLAEEALARCRCGATQTPIKSVAESTILPLVPPPIPAPTEVVAAETPTTAVPEVPAKQYSPSDTSQSRASTPTSFVEKPPIVLPTTTTPEPIEQENVPSFQSLYEDAQTQLRRRDGLLKSTQRRLCGLMTSLSAAHQRYASLVRPPSEMSVDAETSRAAFLEKLGVLQDSLAALVDVNVQTNLRRRSLTNEQLQLTCSFVHVLDRILPTLSSCSNFNSSYFSYMFC
ncbi:kinesin-like protein Klp3 [Schizosaccharomyces japonicus yFS275]|uniref:Kinesin-like protein n=1 Tax=Schizosaccharomyces japonicus (strain yFS275 / FY16936) TaxID=402676 RepID=B6JVC5_SCHJY|nr:kinesin-like protein Klp3 [Schizosaccharomyces japonicus yFS275]EEB05326.1 kinesin-like protein Klp3 [Schizosaccharomyces japonicus yFS275]